MRIRANGLVGSPAMPKLNCHFHPIAGDFLIEHGLLGQEGVTVVFSRYYVHYSQKHDSVLLLNYRWDKLFAVLLLCFGLNWWKEHLLMTTSLG